MEQEKDARQIISEATARFNHLYMVTPHNLKESLISTIVYESLTQRIINELKKDPNNKDLIENTDLQRTIQQCTDMLFILETKEGEQ